MNWTFNTIWTEQLPEGEFQNFEIKNTKVGLSQPIAGSYFIIRNFKPKDRCFENCPAISTATYLELNLSNVHSFRGISKLGQIKRLELHYCTKLNSDEGLSELREEIEWLHINQSKKFSPSNELLSLKRLKVLCLNNCAPLENLKFLSEFPELVDFRFVNTNVIDGDLTPLFEHPTLLTIGFLNKRHYNRTEKETGAFFDARSEHEKEWVYKGDFRTFRYKVFTGID
ncbi:MAG: hypothetical protein ABFD81_11345 [Syntrophaceae bacterium]